MISSINDRDYRARRELESCLRHPVARKLFSSFIQVKRNSLSRAFLSILVRLCGLFSLSLSSTAAIQKQHAVIYHHPDNFSSPCASFLHQTNCTPTRKQRELEHSRETNFALSRNCFLRMAVSEPKIVLRREVRREIEVGGENLHLNCVENRRVLPCFSVRRFGLHRKLLSPCNPI